MKYIFPFLLLFSACGETPSTKEKNNQTFTTLSQDVLLEKETPKAIVFDYDTTQWTELIQLDSTIIIDMRYATTNNFVKEKMYDCNRCFLRPEVAQKIVEALFFEQLQV